MGETVGKTISELLLRNGFFDVEKTSGALARAASSDPEVLKDPSRVGKLIDRDLIVRSGRSRSTIAKIISAQYVMEVPMAHPPQPIASVFVATDLEFSAVTGQLTSVEEAPDADGNWIARGLTPGRNSITVVRTGQGNLNSGSIASALLKVLRPKLTLFCGIAGGRFDQSPGHVVLASYVHDYEAAEDGVERGSRAKSLEVSFKLTQLSGALARRGVDGIDSISVSPIASGEKLITSPSSVTSQWLNTVASDAAVVEMEGLGLMRAASILGIPATVVRAVSDNRHDKTSASDKVNQPIAANAAAKAAVSLIDLFAEGQS